MAHIMVHPRHLTKVCHRCGSTFQLQYPAKPKVTENGQSTIYTDPATAEAETLHIKMDVFFLSNTILGRLLFLFLQFLNFVLDVHINFLYISMFLIVVTLPSLRMCRPSPLHQIRWDRSPGPLSMLRLPQE